MRIAVLGAGAIGSVVAGGLVELGEDVTLIGHADQVKVIEDSGLILKKGDAEQRISLRILERLDQNYDLVILTVKTQDIKQALSDNQGFLKDSVILSTQNGVQADKILSQYFDQKQLISSIVMFGATYMNPGEVILNFPGDWIIGKPYSPNDQNLTEIVDILKKAFSVEVTDHIIGMKWLKLFVNFNNCLPALIGKSMQETFADLELCRLSIQLLKEGIDVIHKANIELVSLPQFPTDRIYGLANMPQEQAAGIMNKTLTSLSKEPLYGSILQSIMRNRPSEIDFINGEVVHIAGQIRAQAPLNDKVVKMVHQVERENKFFDVSDVKKEFNLNC